MTKNSHYHHDWTPEDRERDFWSKVDLRGTDECWPWLGYVAPNGYGNYGGQQRGLTRLVHRIAYAYAVSQIPAGLVLDHLRHTRDPQCADSNDCPHRRCCNPAHLEPVTRGENVRRGRSGDSWGYATDRAAKHVQLALPFCQCGSPKPVYKSGKCRPCYKKWLKDPAVKRPSARTVEERFWEKVNKRGPAADGDAPGRCWIWTASTNRRTGYGQFFPARGKPMDAHRFSYQLANGAIPEEHDVHHRCFRRDCVNPAHLQALPAALNRAFKMNRRAA